MKAAAAALAAGSQGKFWEFHDRLFENYNRLNDQIIGQIATALNLDLAEFEKSMGDPAIEQRIKQDVYDGRQAGVNSTPSVFINGRRLKNRSLEGFQAAIEKEMQVLGKKTQGPTS